LFQGYLGSVEAGKEYDATELVAKYNGPPTPILIDQVSQDTTSVKFKTHRYKDFVMLLRKA